MKVLLAGKTGQVGAQLSGLLPPVAETIALGREAMDLARPDAIREAIRALRPDVIVNAAGYTHVDDAESNAALVHAVNAVAPSVMAEEAKRLGALLVHYSSVYVFDGTATRAYTESDPPNPINEYGRSKLAGEQGIAATGACALILRASWVYDVRGRNFLLTMLRLAAESDVLRVVDDQTGSPAWARSLAEATAAILRDVGRAREAPGVYNVAALDSVNRYDFTQRALEITRARNASQAAPRLTRIKTVDYPLPARRPLNSRLDTAKLQRTFGVVPGRWETQLGACLDLFASGACLDQVRARTP